MSKRSFFLLAALAAVALLGATRPAPAAAQAPKPPAPLQVQETNAAGVVAEFVECKRKEGVLSVKIRLRNSSAQKVGLDVIKSRNFDEYYVTAESKKYLVLKDSEGVPLAPAADGFGSLSVSLTPGGAWTWWAKYPAPPAEAKKINYMTPLGPPFEDIPITDQ